MAGAVILIIGARGSGKSTTLKKRLAKAAKGSHFMHDVNGEHKEFYNGPLLKFEAFKEKAMRLNNAVITIEEATIFLDNRSHDDEVKEFLVKARHAGNTVFLVYHSFRSIPFYIFDLCDYAIVHKTSDTESLVRKKFEHDGLTEAFLEIKASEWIDSGKKKNGKPIYYSKNKLIPIY